MSRFTRTVLDIHFKSYPGLECILFVLYMQVGVSYAVYSKRYNVKLCISTLILTHFHTCMCLMTWSMGVSVMKHRSAEPGVGLAALGSMSPPGG